MNIGDAAAASGVSAKMLRYYESIGLIGAAERSASGYRTYGVREVETLRFIRRARDFGIPMDQVKLLVDLWQDRTRPSREVKRIALQQISELEAKISELTAMKDALAALGTRLPRRQQAGLSDLAGSGGCVHGPAASALARRSQRPFRRGQIALHSEFE